MVTGEGAIHPNDATELYFGKPSLFREESIYMKELITYLEAYSDKKKIAIWPAGLNTISILKNVKDVIFKENIIVFDSNKKNLKVEDIFGVKIYEPKEELIQHMDTIIITSRIYGEEIRQEIIGKYHFRGRILDLYGINISSTDISKWVRENINYIKQNSLSPILFDTRNALVESKSGLYFIYPNSNRNRGAILDILLTGNYEPLETKLFVNNVQEGDIVFDIGANIGWYSLSVAKERKDVMVFSFEPDVEVFQLLKKTVNYNKFNDKIKLNNLAVGEKEGVVLFECEELDMISHVTNKRTENTTEVRCISLDYFVRKEKLNCVDAIKCDIEGAEYFALKGAKDTIEKFKPIILIEITESWCNRYNYNPIVIFDFMKHLGYAYYKIKHDGKIAIESGHFLSDMEEAHNFLFVHKSKTNKLKI